VVLKVVWDTNVFISTFLLHGRSTLLARSLFDGKMVLLVSEPVLDEYFQVAIRPRFGTTHREVRALLEKLAPWMRLVRSPRPLTKFSFPDPSDLKFLECSVVGGAGYLITGDHALLRLKRYQGISIISIASFLEILND